MPKNRNKLLASLKPNDFSLLSRYLREVPIEQGMLLEERGEWVEAVHFPQTGMISLIVEMPEDGSVEVGTIGREGGVGLTIGLGSRVDVRNRPPIRQIFPFAPLHGAGSNGQA